MITSVHNFEQFPLVANYKCWGEWHVFILFPNQFSICALSLEIYLDSEVVVIQGLLYMYIAALHLSQPERCTVLINFKLLASFECRHRNLNILPNKSSQFKQILLNVITGCIIKKIHWIECNRCAVESYDAFDSLNSYCSYLVF